MTGHQGACSSTFQWRGDAVISLIAAATHSLSPEQYRQYYNDNGTPRAAIIASDLQGVPQWKDAKWGTGLSQHVLIMFWR